MLHIHRCSNDVPTSPASPPCHWWEQWHCWNCGIWFHIKCLMANTQSVPHSRLHAVFNTLALTHTFSKYKWCLPQEEVHTDRLGILSIHLPSCISNNTIANIDTFQMGGWTNYWQINDHCICQSSIISALTAVSGCSHVAHVIHGIYTYYVQFIICHNQLNHYENTGSMAMNQQMCHVVVAYWIFLCQHEYLFSPHFNTCIGLW